MKIFLNMLNVLNRKIIWQNLKWRDLGNPTLWFAEISYKDNWAFNSDSYFIAISWKVTIKQRVLEQSAPQLLFYDIYVKNGLCGSLRRH